MGILMTGDTKRNRLIQALRTPYVITDIAVHPGRGHLTIARAALQGGAKMIQLREKHLPDEIQIAIARQLTAMAREAGAILIVNDRLEVAAESGAHGLHVGGTDVMADIARERLGEDAVIGVSASTIEEAIEAERMGADYVGVGPIMSTNTKSDAGSAVGVDLIRAIREKITIPIVAIGGLTADNLAPVVQAGADGIAVISAVVAADDMIEATKRVAMSMARARGDIDDAV
jgi:thiamine-phosphate pyrophosphorylase